jgi:hypothetical protein
LKPKSLKGSLILGKFLGAPWTSDPIRIGNVNVYSRKLSIEDMKLITNGTRCGEDGDYLAWSNSMWTIEGEISKVIEVEKGELCNMKHSTRYIHGKQTNEDLRQTCKKLGKSEMHLPKNAEHSNEVLQFFKDTVLEIVEGDYKGFPGECNSYHIAAFDTLQEDGWINQNTGKPMDYFEWIPGQPNSKNQRCATQQPTFKWGTGKTWYDTECDDSLCVVCENEARPIFQIRGLCKESKLSNVFTPNNDGERGYLGYTGFSTCYINYNSSSFQWNMMKYGEREKWTWAISNAARETALIGTHDWVIFNDSRQCSTEFELHTRLTLTSCNAAEFTCNDGICIGMNNRCDGRADCLDKSDEIGCEIVVSEPSYNKGMNPSPKDKQKKAKIAISVRMKVILGINEIEQSFRVSYELASKWKDPRLTYHNLKKNSNLNVLSQKEQSSIWTPTLVLVNTQATETINQDKDTLTKVIANAEYSHTVSDITSIQNIFIFEGEENHLEMSRALETVFICKYNMALYPFDTQTCTMDFLLTGVSDDFCFLENGGLIYTGPTELTQYFIKDRYMIEIAIDGQKGIKVYFILGRRLLSNTLTVYLPTILLNIIGHLTVYFKPYFFEV